MHSHTYAHSLARLLIHSLTHSAHSLTHSAHSLTTHTHSLAHSLTHLHTHSLTHHTHSLTLSLTHSLICTLIHSLTHSLRSLTHSLTHSLIRTLTHPHTHSLTHSLTHSHTHSLAHSFTHSLSHTHTCTHTLVLLPLYTGILAGSSYIPIPLPFYTGILAVLPTALIPSLNPLLQPSPPAQFGTKLRPAAEKISPAERPSGQHAAETAAVRDDKKQTRTRTQQSQARDQAAAGRESQQAKVCMHHICRLDSQAARNFTEACCSSVLSVTNTHSQSATMQDLTPQDYYDTPSIIYRLYYCSP